MNQEAQYQLLHSICSMRLLGEAIDLTSGELAEMDRRIKITPYILQLIKEGNTHIRRQFVPFTSGTYVAFSEDYLQEERHSPIENLVHRYKSKAIYIVTNQCACYCQFCTRQRITQCARPYRDNLEQVLNYLGEHREINDLLITGGDPLILDTPKIVNILDAISSLPQINVMRIGTRIPITLPMRIDSDLLDALGKYENLYINIHVNHPSELTAVSKKVILALADRGIPVGSQTVLLKGINNDENVLRELFEKLISIKVKPYYLYQCDKVKGCEEYVADVLEGIRIVNRLCNTMSGFAIPKFVVDTPELGKMILAPCSILSMSERKLTLASPEGECSYETPSFFK